MKVILACTLFCVLIFALTFSVAQAADDDDDDDYQCGDPNAVYLSCGTACRATCQGRKRVSCMQYCVRGCFCKPHFIFDEELGKCVTFRDCSQYRI
ncbi:hypothetical protein NQ315_000796 [Exocentrus adspersus]|uniref:TIL domain-containing protein n=1 Tax=Exocentrus adspersus TaxID=1586481 RepID=A0AAV8WES5_9CUCU|nr:hypothetical protein NQ315_000796 [Exocentrus adspersus]